MVIEKAYAKINLFLNVLGKRKDGYHDLEMINVKIDLCDTLEIRKTDMNGCVIIKSNDLFLSNQDNIVIQTAKYMLRNFKIDSGLEIKIDKNIPFGAGLGGNSSDSAAVIRGINRLFDLKLSIEKMMDIGLNYGADIPYCLVDYPAIVKGIGEKVEKIEMDLSGYKLLLANPKEFISTKEVFRLASNQETKKRDINKIIELIKSGNTKLFLKETFNSLEEIVVDNYPKVKAMRNLIVSALGSENLVMSGSGSSFVKVLEKDNLEVLDFIDKNNTDFCFKMHNFL